MWGEVASRAFLPSPDGSVSYCRAVGRTARALSCTALDPDARSWGPDRTSSRTPRLVSDATWVTTPTGPARCGLTGSAGRPTATCTVLTVAGWHSVTTGAPWGTEDSRAFIATHDGRDRLLPLASRVTRRPQRVRRPRPLHPDLGRRPRLSSPARRRSGVPHLDRVLRRTYRLLVALGRASRCVPCADHHGLADDRAAQAGQGRHRRHALLPDRPRRARVVVPPGGPHRGLHRPDGRRPALEHRTVDPQRSLDAGRQPDLGLPGLRPRPVRPRRQGAPAAARLPGAHRRRLADDGVARRLVGQPGLPGVRAQRFWCRLLPHGARPQEGRGRLLHADEQASSGVPRAPRSGLGSRSPTCSDAAVVEERARPLVEEGAQRRLETR